jgi:hypothetical protein
MGVYCLDYELLRCQLSAIGRRLRFMDIFEVALAFCPASAVRE